jgi:ABC-type polysaccharide/polyol phosphate export permease
MSFGKMGLSLISFKVLPTVLPTFWHCRALTLELVKRELTGRNRGSFGGVLWFLVQHLRMLTVYSIVFGVIMRAGAN